MKTPDSIEKLVASVRAKPRYRHISVDLIHWVGIQELAKRKNLKEAVKATRSKLHQVGAAYLERSIDYDHWLSELEALGSLSVDSSALKEYCRRVMAQHTSSRERLPILEQFYSQTLGALAPIHSVLDLGCGLNPLAMPWMPLAEDAKYFACDIYNDMIDFINQFLCHLQHNGKAIVCDLIRSCPSHKVEMALLLKNLPCLEQLDKKVGVRLLESIQAEHLLVSYPIYSLGKRYKGMLTNYESHFREMIDGRGWEIQRYEFATELAFLISR